MVVPKRHVENIHELSMEEIKTIFKTVKFVAGKIRNSYKPIAINYGFNEGKIAGQEVDHFYFHIMPRYLNDDMPEFHLFHGDPQKKEVFEDQELSRFVKNLKFVLNN